MNDSMNSSNYNGDNNKKKLSVVLICLVVLLFLGVGVFLIINSNDFFKKGNSIENKSNEELEEVVISEKEYEEEQHSESEVKNNNNKFNGIYKYNENILKIYGINDNRLFYDLSSSSSSIGHANIDGDTATAIVFDTRYEFTLNENGIAVNVSDSVEDSGVYIKQSDYLSEDYYRDNYGDPAFLSSIYNGIYKKGQVVAYLFQISKDKVRVNIEMEGSFSDLEYDIKEDGSLYGEIFDDIYSIFLEDDKLIFTTIKTEDEEKKYDGEYIKESNLTIEDILKKFEEMSD